MWLLTSKIRSKEKWFTSFCKVVIMEHILKLVWGYSQEQGVRSPGFYFQLCSRLTVTKHITLLLCASYCKPVTGEYYWLPAFANSFEIFQKRFYKSMSLLDFLSPPRIFFWIYLLRLLQTSQMLLIKSCRLHKCCYILCNVKGFQTFYSNMFMTTHTSA